MIPVSDVPVAPPTRATGWTTQGELRIACRDLLWWRSDERVITEREGIDMPLHQQVTKCLRGGGKVSRYCGCQHCCLAVCSVCGAYEGSLTTDCPGERVDYDKQQEVYTTMLDYVDGRGWHLSEHGMRDRAAHFALTEDQMAAVETAIDEANPAQQWELRSGLSKLLGFYKRSIAP